MKKRYFSIQAAMLLSVALLAGCGGTSTQPMIKSPSFQTGEADGCATAKGEYSKNSDLFQSDPDYEKGWFQGRKNCNPSFHME